MVTIDFKVFRVLRILEVLFQIISRISLFNNMILTSKTTYHYTLEHNCDPIERYFNKHFSLILYIFVNLVKITN
jgi:hypothetical protein